MSRTKKHIYTNAEEYPFKLPFDNNVGQDAFREVGVAPELPDVDEEFKVLNCYKGNTKLKRAGVKVPLAQEHIDEIGKCKHDIFYFLMNYCTILSLDEGAMKFKLFQYQKNMIKLMNENRYVINLLPRQAGKCVVHSTIIKIRNKSTGQIEDVQIGDFFNSSSSF